MTEQKEYPTNHSINDEQASLENPHGPKEIELNSEYKVELMEFPSGDKFPRIEIRGSSFVILLDGLLLPLDTDMQAAFEFVTDLAKKQGNEQRAQGEVTRKETSSSFKVWESDLYNGVLITYEDDKIYNVQKIQEPATPAVSVKTSLPRTQLNS